jgi:3-oxoacyl-[acyl-carrier protein] reductase
MVDTRFLAGVPELVKEKAAASSPKGRNASPEEVVGAIEFLLSEDANYITGVELPVAAGSVY